LQVLLRRKRVAISEILATLIMIAITLIAGAAVFGWVNGEIGVSAGAVGSNVAVNVNYLREHEVISLVNFPNDTSVSSWVYNTGMVELARYNLSVSGYICPANNPTCLSSTPKSDSIVCSSGGPCTFSSLVGGCTASMNPANKAIATEKLVQLTVKISGCSFEHSVAPPPYLSVYLVTFIGQFGSVASATTTR
jgi:flagellin-like protein